MLTIKNGFNPARNVKVHWKELNGTTWFNPIPGGGSHQPPSGIKKGLILKALDDKPIDSSIRISNLPNDHSINISYNTTDKTWTLEKGIKKGIDFLIRCPTNVNVEIGP